MGKYGDTAVQAVRLYSTGSAQSPREAWELAAAVLFSSSPSGQAKGCPRDAFLGLCMAGVVKGIPPGPYTDSEANKQYALDAVTLLRRRPSLAENASLLWSEVLQGRSKKHNRQMDVVIALWKRGLIT